MCACNQAAHSAVAKGQQSATGKDWKRKCLDADNQVAESKQAVEDASAQLECKKMRLVYFHIRMQLDICLLVYVLLVHQSICLWFCLTSRPSIQLCVRLSSHLSFCLSIPLCVGLSVSMAAVCLSVCTPAWLCAGSERSQVSDGKSGAHTSQQ